MKGKELKKSDVTFEYGGKQYPLRLDFNVLAELEEIEPNAYKVLEQASAGSPKGIRALLYANLKSEGLEATLKEVGASLNCLKADELYAKIMHVIQESLPEKKDEEPDEGNMTPPPMN